MKKQYIWIMAAIFVAFALCVPPLLQYGGGVPVFSEQNARQIIVIDPGHGGEDGGAIGSAGTSEKGINLQISQKLSDLLGFYGYETLLTRTDDISIHSGDAGSIHQKKTSDIKNRVKIANKTQNSTLISVHLNFFPQQSCHGAQVFYSKNHADGKPLAEAVQKALVTGLDPKNHRVAKQGEEHIYLLKNVTCPAILVECGFLSNPREEQLLKQENHQKKIATCIAAGFLGFRNGSE